MNFHDGENPVNDSDSINCNSVSDKKFLCLNFLIAHLAGSPHHLLFLTSKHIAQCNRQQLSVVVNSMLILVRHCCILRKSTLNNNFASWHCNINIIEMHQFGRTLKFQSTHKQKLL